MTGNLKILNAPIGTGKTTYIAKQIVTSSNPVVYVTVTYDQLNRIKSEIVKLNHTKKIVELRGQKQNCIFPERYPKCTGCPYNKKPKSKPDTRIYDREFYKKQNCCPLVNCREESKGADVILTHYSYLLTLYRTNPENIPINLQDTILFMDEADKGIQTIAAKPWLVYEAKNDKIYTKLLELGEKGYLSLFERVLSHPELKKIEPKIPRLWNYYLKSFDLTEIHRGDTKSTIEKLENKRNTILNDLKKITGFLSLYYFEKWLFENDFGLGRDYEIKVKEQIMNWIRVIVFLVDFKIIKNKNGHYEVYLLPARHLIFESAMLSEFKEIWLASGSLTESDLAITNIATDSKQEIIDHEIKNEFLQEHVLILVCDDYEIKKLVYNLDRKKYLTYITHSSFNIAEQFTKEIMKVITATPKNLSELNENLSNGITSINMVQNSYNIASNNRLDGDVTIVNPNSYISKDVLLYNKKDELAEKSILRGTYQALGRIINSEKRPVVLVMPEEVYHITKEKWDSVRATIKKVTNDEILNEITKWVPNPIGRDYSKKHQRIDEYKKFKPVKNGKRARLVIEKEPSFIGKEAHITTF